LLSLNSFPVPGNKNLGLSRSEVKSPCRKAVFGVYAALARAQTFRGLEGLVLWLGSGLTKLILGVEK